jgi:hypothetical protein
MNREIKFALVIAANSLLLAGCSTTEKVATSEAPRTYNGSGQPPRFHAVDLTKYYDKEAGSWPAGSSWSAVPWGNHTYDGVPFELGGIVEVTGIDAARNIGEVFPGRYTGIPVGRTAPWIHLVHGAGWKEADGVPIARLTLHYENGQTSALLIRYGVNVRDWWKEPSELDGGLADPNSKLIWSAPNPEQTGRPVTLRLYKTSFANPHPRWVVTTLDIESLFSHATPVVVAITVGSAGEGVSSRPVAPASIPERFTQRMVVRAADTGKPISGACVQVVLSDGERNYPFGEQITDAAGRTVIDFSRVQICRLTISVSAPGYETRPFSMFIMDLPPELELKLKP